MSSLSQDDEGELAGWKWFTFLAPQPGMGFRPARGLDNVSMQTCEFSTVYMPGKRGVGNADKMLEQSHAAQAERQSRCSQTRVRQHQ